MSWLKDAARAVLTAGDALFARLATAPPAESPRGVFIIGGPRSGSTLLYQALLHTRRFAYVNNAVSRFPRSAEVVARWLRVGSWAAPSSFASDYGDTQGWSGASEAGEIWDAIFPWDAHHSVAADEFTTAQIERLRQLVGGLSAVYRAPFLCKNLWHSVRLEAIDRALPGSVFIVCARRPLVLAQSVLAGRRQALGDEPGLWSIRPRELLAWEAAPPVEQVAQQLLLTYQAIDAARVVLGPDRFFDVPYEAFCADPDGWIARIDDFLSGHGIEIEARGSIAEPFALRDRIGLSDEEREHLAQLLPESFLSAG